jgi:Sec7-like guanine-nucleotide exchange factor
MARFDFRDWPLDMALRRLLLEIKLPNETQQIDRILGAFAAVYEISNPGLSTSPGKMTFGYVTTGG